MRLRTFALLGVLAAALVAPLLGLAVNVPVLLGAVIATQTVATLITVYGLFIAPIGWPLAIFVWVYALIWALVITDPVKVYAYRLIDHAGIRFAR